ncbi:MAG TPA: alpha/beta hydrolase [Mycobacteriales bacterium]|nr:alpha/beta hydrolase [Mycobacteriales bacterium]
MLAAVDRVQMQHRVIHGHRRAFRMGGSGPPLLLLHGIGDSSETWADVIEPLARRYTVIAPDLLGHGESDRPRADYAISAYACGMRDLLSVLGVERVTVLGHSLGGGIAMQFAYQFPERCDRLVLVGSGGVGRAVHPLLRAAAAPGAEIVMPLVTSAPMRRLIRRATPFVRHMPFVGLGPDTDYVVQRFDGLSSARSRSAFLRTLRAGVDARGQVVTMLDRCYLAAGLPTLIVWGERDRIIPVEHARTAHRALPGSRLEVFARSGHFPHHDEPDRFVSVVKHFLAETPAATYDATRWRELLRRAPIDPETLVAIDGNGANSSGS